MGNMNERGCIIDELPRNQSDLKAALDKIKLEVLRNMYGERQQAYKEIWPDIGLCPDGIPGGEPVARLIAAAPELAELVLAVEWVWDAICGDNYCPWCAESQTTGHAPDCPRQMALRNAGLLEDLI